MADIVSTGANVSDDIDTRLINTQAEIEWRKAIIFKKYLPILSHIKIQDKNITKGQLIEFKNYLGSELAKMTQWNIKQITDSINTGFGFEKGVIDNGIMNIVSSVELKAQRVMNMESIGHPDSTGSVSYDANPQNLEMPLFLFKLWARLPTDQKWTDLYALIELVWLLIVQKEYLAEKTILNNTADISARQAEVLRGK